MVTAKQAWFGIVVLFLVVLLAVIFAVYWHHVTGVNTMHMLLSGYIPEGC